MGGRFGVYFTESIAATLQSATDASHGDLLSPCSNETLIVPILAVLLMQFP